MCVKALNIHVVLYGKVFSKLQKQVLLALWLPNQYPNSKSHENVMVKNYTPI